MVEQKNTLIRTLRSSQSPLAPSLALMLGSKGYPDRVTLMKAILMDGISRAHAAVLLEWYMLATEDQVFSVSVSDSGDILVDTDAHYEQLQTQAGEQRARAAWELLVEGSILNNKKLLSAALVEMARFCFHSTDTKFTLTCFEKLISYRFLEYQALVPLTMVVNAIREATPRIELSVVMTDRLHRFFNYVSQWPYNKWCLEIARILYVARGRQLEMHEMLKAMRAVEPVRIT